MSDEKRQGEAGLPFQNPTLGAAIGRQPEDGLTRPGGPGPTRDSGFFSSTRVAATPPCTSDAKAGGGGRRQPWLSEGEAGLTQQADADRSALIEHYSEWWEHPADIRNSSFGRMRDLVRARIPPAAPGARALELGAGRGRIARLLLERGYEVTAVDLNPKFVRHLRATLPGARVIHCDLAAFDPAEEFDVVTLIEVTQNLSSPELRGLLSRLMPRTGRLLLDVSNVRSLYGWWCRLRGFQASFVHPHTPGEVLAMLSTAGFRAAHTAGISLVTPISLRSGFRTPIVPTGLAGLLTPLDRLAPRLCHLFYIEAAGGKNT